MNSYTTENEIIVSCLKELKLPAIKDLLEDTITDATEQNWSFRKFLCTLLMREMEQRVENRKYQRIGIKACMEGFTVYFTSVQRLLTQIREAKAQKMLQSLEYKFKKYDLVICDEMGYVSFDKEGAELLFSHLSLRSGSKATIITTNFPFTRWEEIMKDRVLCSALVDRLCHKAYLVNMTGKSYRIRETQNMFKK